MIMVISHRVLTQCPDRRASLRSLGYAQECIRTQNLGLSTNFSERVANGRLGAVGKNLFLPRLAEACRILPEGKYQTQTSNFKHQAPDKNQTSNTKRSPVRRYGVWGIYPQG